MAKMVQMEYNTLNKHNIFYSTLDLNNGSKNLSGIDICFKKDF